MNTLLCPHCQRPVLDDGSLAGQHVSCPHCSAQFVIPGVAPTAVNLAPQIRFSSVAATRFKPSNSLFDMFFDFKFERYVTPRIIRATWGAAVILALFGVLLAGYEALAAWIPESEQNEKPDRRQSKQNEKPAGGQRVADRPQLEFHPEGLQRMLPEPRQSAKLFESFVSIAKLAAIGLALLWIRVGLETMIVVFNIAESLASIDKKTNR